MDTDEENAEARMSNDERMTKSISQVLFCSFERESSLRLFLESKAGPGTVPRMALTLEQIVEETRRWPPEKVGELVGRLTDDLHASPPDMETAWKIEIDQRIEEIQSGKVQGLPGEGVSAQVGKIAGR